MANALGDVRVADARKTGFPSGHVRYPKAWRGVYTVGKTEFKIPALYAFPKFFGLVCDTVQGKHTTAVIKRFVDTANESL